LTCEPHGSFCGESSSPKMDVPCCPALKGRAGVGFVLPHYTIRATDFLLPQAGQAPFIATLFSYTILLYGSSRRLPNFFNFFFQLMFERFLSATVRLSVFLDRGCSLPLVFVFSCCTRFQLQLLQLMCGLVMNFSAPRFCHLRLSPRSSTFGTMLSPERISSFYYTSTFIVIKALF